jgi:hypothetical protein
MVSAAGAERVAAAGAKRVSAAGTERVSAAGTERPVMERTNPSFDVRLDTDGGAPCRYS